MAKKYHKLAPFGTDPDYVPGRKSSDFKTALGQPQRTIERWLKQLKDTEKIEFRGAPKTGGYFVRLDKS